MLSLLNMEIGCPNWHQASPMQHWHTGISGCIPQALTTTLEALSKEEKLEFQKLADEWNEEGPLDEQKRK